MQYLVNFATLIPLLFEVVAQDLSLEAVDAVLGRWPRCLQPRSVREAARTLLIAHPGHARVRKFQVHRLRRSLGLLQAPRSHRGRFDHRLLLLLPTRCVVHSLCRRVASRVLELGVGPGIVIVLVEVNHLALLRLHGAEGLDESLPLWVRVGVLQGSVQLIDVLVVLAILRIGREVVRVLRGGEALGHG